MLLMWKISWILRLFWLSLKLMEILNLLISLWWILMLRGFWEIRLLLLGRRMIRLLFLMVIIFLKLAKKFMLQVLGKILINFIKDRLIIRSLSKMFWLLVGVLLLLIFLSFCLKEISMLLFWKLIRKGRLIFLKDFLNVK